jgi:hypothetical protein
MDDTRVPWTIMGKLIGTATGWDIQDTLAFIIYDFESNELGLEFIPNFVGPRDLGVNFDTGEVAIYDIAGNETLLVTNWSVFNRTEQAAGWLAGSGR